MVIPHRQPLDLFLCTDYNHAPHICHRPCPAPVKPALCTFVNKGAFKGMGDHSKVVGRLQDLTLKLPSFESLHPENQSRAAMTLTKPLRGMQWMTREGNKNMFWM